MDIKETMRSLFQEMIIPEFEHMKTEQGKIVERLNSVDTRLNDINAHIIDQSRRIDETNKRIDSIRDELVTMIGETNKRIDETNKRIDSLYEVIVRRDEHVGLERKLENIEERVGDLERRLAA